MCICGFVCMCIYILNYDGQYEYTNIFVYIYIFLWSYMSLIDNVPTIAVDDLTKSQY